jgi:hypothetical protein
MRGLFLTSISSKRPLMMVVAVNPAAGVAQTRPVFATLQSAVNPITALLHTRRVHFGGTSVFCPMRLLF